MSNSELKIRIAAGTKAWLECRAKSENRSMNAEILRLIAEAMKTDPLQVFVHDVAVFGLPPVFTVSIGEFGDDLFETPDRNQAVAFALAKAKELGLPKTAIVFNAVSDGKAA